MALRKLIDLLAVSIENLAACIRRAIDAGLLVILWAAVFIALALVVRACS